MTKKLLTRLEAKIGNPAEGLPQEIFLFASRVTPMVNVDLLIRDGGGGTLLTWRDDGYCAPGWHVPGGIVRFKETMAERIAKTARAELGAAVTCASVPLAVNEVVHPSRKDRGHFISLLYKCRLAGAPDKTLMYKAGPPRPGQWAWHKACPRNLLSVHRMYRKYLQPKRK